MERLINNPRRLLVMGATLAIAALVVTLLATSFAGAPAQAQEAHPTPEACNPNPDDVITRGSVALFDVYWDTTSETLNNNPCPPKVMHMDVPGGFGQPPTEVTTRMPSDVDIRHTVVHIRHLAQRTLVKDDDPRRTQPGYLGVAKDSLLWQAYGDDQATQQTVWFLPVFESEEQEHMHEEAFHLGFSAGLLREGDWQGNFVQYEFEANRELDVAPRDRGVILIATDNSFAGDDVVQWDTRKPDRRVIRVAPGEYQHRAWAFTRPGTYTLSVQAKGVPSDSLVPGSKIGVATSVARQYTFHVGLLSDLEVEVEAVGQAPRPGGTVDFNVTASNAGPDIAPDTEVKIELSEGLTFASSSAGTDYDAKDARRGVWSVGNLGTTTRPTMTLTLNVAQNTHGEELSVTASIQATETIGGSEVTELDPHTEYNTRVGTVTPVAAPNTKPIFSVAREVAENAPAGTPVGDPLAVYDPEGDELKFSLSGKGADQFEISTSTYQILVAERAFLNHECTVPDRYSFEVGVSDGKDELGNDDPSVDNNIRVEVSVLDESEGSVDLHASNTRPRLSEAVTLTARLGSTDVCPSLVSSYVWKRVDLDGIQTTLGEDTPQIEARYDTEGPRTYTVFVTITGSGGTSLAFERSVEILWFNPPNTE